MTPRVAGAMDYMPVGMVISDLEGRILKANPAYCALVGRTEAELLGRTVDHFTHPDDIKDGDRAADEILAGKCVTRTLEKRYLRPDGTGVWALASGSLLRDENGHALAIFGVVQDLSRIKAAEDALRAANEALRRDIHESRADLSARRVQAEHELDRQRAFLRQVLDLVPQFIFAKDRQGRFTLVNRAVAEAYGTTVEELTGKTDADFNPNADEVEQFRRVDREVMDTQREVHVPEEVITDAQGETRWLETVKRPILDEDGRADQVLGVAFDITERKRLEEQIRLTQKLESLGLLAGGIAHDFNNLLVGILGNIGLARMQAETPQPLQELLIAIETAAKRAADLTRQMLAYSGRTRISVEEIDLSRLAREMIQLLKTAVSKKARFECEFARELPAVRGDPTQLRQVVMNLVTNASESLPEGTGTITVRTGAVQADRRDLAATYVDDGLPAGQYVFIEVTDNGVGMDPPTRARIFDPFFTTKFAGRGLGLAAVLGIVRGHQGAISLSSEPDRGTAVRVLLPALARPVSPAERADDPWLGGWRGHGCVLVADDEEPVRNVARSSLQHFGFEVVTARDGEEALALFEADPDRFAAVLLDATMPGLSGAETLRAIRRLRPDAKAILSSGYDEKDASAGSLPSAFLEKPYTPEQLIVKLRAILLA